MRALRQFPVNPHTLVIHTEGRLTDRVVETYLARSGGPAPEWVRAALALPGARSLSITAYRVLFQKEKNVSWQGLADRFERVLRAGLQIDTLLDWIPEESPDRVFAWHGRAVPRAVFESVERARSDPIANRLFAIDGVAQVIRDGHQVHVRKSPLYRWDQLAGQIDTALAEGAASP